MELRSITSTTLPVGGQPFAQVPGVVENSPSTNLQDRLDELGSEKAGIEDKLSAYASGQKLNAKVYKITRTAALAGGAVFIAGAIMASMLPFVAGAAVGALTYIASGYFKGRTEWFGREIGIAASDHQRVRKEYDDTEKLVSKAKADVRELAKGLESSARSEDVVDDDDFVYIDGIKLQKKMRHLYDVVDDLFGKLPGR